MDAKCYRCKAPAKKSSNLRGVLCSKCYYTRNREKIIARMEKWRTENRERMREGESKRYLKRKIESIEAYGGMCAHCDQKDVKFLVIDHINDDGAEDRRVWKNKVADIHLWLKKNKYPIGYQVLCGNCNLKKERMRRKEKCSKSWVKNNDIRLGVLQKYGSKCECCKESDPDFLVIDHINGGGSKEKQSYPSRNIYLFLVKQPKDPSRYQILCHNCNQAKESFGVCPHQDSTGSSRNRETFR